MTSKIMGLDEAIARYVVDGSSVALGLALEHAIPFAACHEIIRQGKRRLTLIGPISDIAFDQLIGAGCVSRVIAAWVGNVSHGIGHNFSRAVEEGRIEVCDYSNLSLASALLAGALGIPCIPTQTLTGSDMLKTLKAKGLAKAWRCPFTGKRLTLLRAITPDVAIIHTQRCDELGYAQMWGNLGIVREACQATRRIIVTTEELVSHDFTTRDPNSVVCPAHKVVAVVEVRLGAHPSPLTGYYNRDNKHFTEYFTRSRTREGFEEWLRDWVYGVGSREEYLRRVDFDSIRVGNVVSSPVRAYGY